MNKSYLALPWYFKVFLRKEEKISRLNRELQYLEHMLGDCMCLDNGVKCSCSRGKFIVSTPMILIFGRGQIENDACACAICAYRRGKHFYTTGSIISSEVRQKKDLVRACWHAIEQLFGFPQNFFL